jgi:septal ring factor EnvC (AmiA/AmiB activator)
MGDRAATAPNASAKQAYIVVGVVAATVSAATAAYIFWQRSRRITPQIESVQQLLDRCHDQVHTIEQRLGELNASATTLTA